MKKTFELQEYKVSIDLSHTIDELLERITNKLSDRLEDSVIQTIKLELNKKFRESLDEDLKISLESSMQIELKSYDFRDLSDEIQEKVLYKNRHFNIFDDWWLHVYEQAEECGIKVKSFDLGRADYCKISFMEYPEDTAKYILEQWGKDTDIYKAGKEFLTAFNDINEDSPDAIDVEEELKVYFLEKLSDIIKNQLASELDYLESDEAIIESFEANGYKFDKEGNML